MIEFIKKNIFIVILFIITLFVGFLTFLTFIDKSFISLNETNLQYLLAINIFLLIFFFVLIFFEIKKNSSKTMFPNNNICKFLSFNSMKLLSINVKNVKKPTNNVTKNIKIINIFFLINSFIV